MINRRRPMTLNSSPEVTKALWVRPRNLPVSPQAYPNRPQTIVIDALECNLSKCLVLSAMMRKQEMLSDSEIDDVKWYLMTV